MNDEPNRNFGFSKATSYIPAIPGTEYPRKGICGDFISDDEGDRKCQTVTMKNTPLDRCPECKKRRATASRKRRGKVTNQKRKEQRAAR